MITKRQLWNGIAKYYGWHLNWEIIEAIHKTLKDYEKKKTPIRVKFWATKKVKVKLKLRRKDGSTITIPAIKIVSKR
jgi:hypothetical protein